MIKIDIYSGFLGAGKTTLIRKMISEAYTGEKIVLIENEFGDIAIDGGFLQDAGVEITEMSSGCICCTLVGDFSQALNQVAEQFSPDRIIIEPSGVGKLSDVIAAVQRAGDLFQVNAFTAVVDATKCKIYLKNFGEFYNNQILSAGAVILSRTGNIAEKKLNEALELIRGINPNVTIVTTPWEELSGKQLLDVIERNSSLTDELMALVEEAEREAAEHEAEEAEEEHHHEHHHDEEEHEHHHHDEEEHEHHHHDEDEDEHHHDEDEHEHHHHDEDEDEHHHDDEDEHEHHHEGHHHHHHHGHDADEVFQSWGMETPKKFTKENLEQTLNSFSDEEKYGIVLRAKGIVPAEDGTWLHFDFVPEEMDIRTGPAGVTGRLCVIGSGLKEPEIQAAFGL
ncbi:MAG: GTP-binding protein [Oscillospiraceae bacterium]|nr:GTP-binding protein [Oscillospiraceae bacterium]